MIKPDMQAIAYHGWGFDSLFWHPLITRLDHILDIQTADRGYFLSHSEPFFSDYNDQPRVIFAHSLGLHLCPDQVLKKADHLIVFGGFLRFYPAENKLYKKKKMMVRQWMTQLVDQPREALMEYYHDSFYPDEPEFSPPAQIDHEKLMSDLSILDRDDNSLQRYFDIPRITILHGADDRIIGQEQAREMYHTLRFNSQYFELLNTGHAFPFTHPDKCAEIVQTVLTVHSSQA